MFLCYVCGIKTAELTVFKSHLRSHEAFGKLVLPIKCLQTDCSAYFTKLCSFFRHLGKYHATDSTEDQQECMDLDEIDLHAGVRSTVTDDSNAEESAESCSKNSTQCYRSLEQEASCLVASLRGNSSIPHSVVPDIMLSCQQMINVSLQDVRSKIADELSTLLTQECKLKLDKVFEQYEDQIQCLTTRYKQDAYFERHALFVKPEECVFGSRHENNRHEQKLVYDTFQYVSIEANLRALMQSEAYVKMLLNSMEVTQNCGCLTEFYDGETYRTKFNDSSKFTILLQLFFDGMGTTNPLRGHSSALCNMGVFYYVIKNLSNVLNSCHANVHLLSLCYSHDLKVYGYEPILDKFVSEINRLSSDGFTGVFPVIGKKTIYVKLSQVVCDNLALNGLFGFVECFVWDFFCTICTATQTAIQTCFEEHMFSPRTRQSYSADLTELSSLQCNKLHVHGIKRSCALNNIRGYHIVDNYALDPMHILLEGVVPLEVGCVLYMLITVKKLIPLSEMNRRIVSFFGHNWVDKKNCPPELNVLEQMGGGLSPSMKAVQCWTLLRFLPMLLGNEVDEDDEHWILILHLSHLVDLVFAPKFTESMISYLRQVICDHLHMFSSLFGDTVKLRAKHHLLVHLPTIVLKSGPLVGMCCLKYELKNCFFKRSASIMSNFKNVCKTLAYRHQCNALYAILSGSHTRDYVVPGKTIPTVLSSTPYCDATISAVSCESTELVAVATKVSRATVVYNVGSAVVIGENNELPVFGKIVCFISVRDSDWLIIVQSMHTCNFDAHFHAYCVQNTTPAAYMAVRFSELKDHHALFLYKVTPCKVTKYLVRLPYHIIVGND